MDALLKWDEALFRWINWNVRNPVLDGIMVFASSPWTWAILVLWFLAAGIRRKNKRLLMSIVTIGIAIAVVDMVSFYVLKPFFGRMRPCHQLESVRLIGGACGGELSMPSNHAANAASVVAAASIAQRAFLPGATVVAFIVGFSRVYMGVHYPFDVMVGWLFGGILGCVIQFGLELSLRKWVHFREPD